MLYVTNGLSLSLLLLLLLLLLYRSILTQRSLRFETVAGNLRKRRPEDDCVINIIQYFY